MWCDLGAVPLHAGILQSKYSDSVLGSGMELHLKRGKMGYSEEETQGCGKVLLRKICASSTNIHQYKLLVGM